MHPDDCEMYFGNFVRALYECEQVASVKMVLRSAGNVGKMSAVNDACVLFRHRPMHLSINDVIYLPVGR